MLNVVAKDRNDMSKNKKSIIRILIIFVSILMILSLIGCGKMLSGVYVSDYDSSRKLIFEKSGVLTIISGEEKESYSYGVVKEKYDMGTPINVVTVSGLFNSSYTDMFAVQGDKVISLVNGETFVKKSFLKSLWMKHKVLIIIAFIILVIIGFLYEKYEEWRDRKDKN